MTKKIIMFVVPSLMKGGAERVVSILANYFSNQFDVIITILGAEPPQYHTKAELIWLNTDIQKSKLLKILNIFVRFFRLRKIIKVREPDLVISFMETANIPTIFAVKSLSRRVPLIISVRNNSLLFPWYYRLAIKLLYCFPDQVVAPSLGISNDLNKQILGNRSIKFIPNPIDLDIVTTRADNEFTAKFSLPQKYILAVGRLTHQKGFDRLISIFSQLQIDDLYLIIIGEGELRLDLNNLINFHGLENRIIMPGLVDNPFPLYKNALCLALTSRYEGWPNVINESIASGCPVVSYDCRYGPSEILNGANGFLIDEGNESEFLKAVHLLNDDKELREGVINNGLENVKQYSIARISDRWLEIAGSNFHE